jgi:hypothetical protein
MVIVGGSFGDLTKSFKLLNSDRVISFQ